ncbi:hypothetical protein [Enterococcus sp. DIV0187]|uniref:hypothetical protein n=1 Tax=Enterococcus sp. DIV0187 TaxID=2774644 RepID=UPI003F297671
MKQVVNIEYLESLIGTIDKTWLAHWNITKTGKVTDVEKNRVKIIIYNYSKLLTEIKEHENAGMLRIITQLVQFRIDQCSRILEDELVNKQAVIKSVKKNDKAFKKKVLREMMKWQRRSRM